MDSCLCKGKMTTSLSTADVPMAALGVEENDNWKWTMGTRTDLGNSELDQGTESGY